MRCIVALASLTFCGCYLSHPRAPRPESMEPDASIDSGLDAPGPDAHEPPSCFEWTAATFDYPRDPTSCEGPQWVRFSEEQGLWIGVVDCGHGARFYLSGDGAHYHPAIDLNGSGEDFCELVNPRFTLPDELDIHSGGCHPCWAGFVAPLLDGRAAFGRRDLGDPFELVDPTEELQQVGRVECGIRIPTCEPAPER